MMTGGRLEGGSGYIKDHHKQREEENYSKLLQDSVIVTAAEAAARICKQLKLSKEVHEVLNYSHIHTQNGMQPPVSSHVTR